LPSFLNFVIRFWVSVPLAAILTDFLTWFFSLSRPISELCALEYSAMPHTNLNHCPPTINVVSRSIRTLTT
jgi:hypothetical protein